MANFNEFVANIGAFNTSVVIPFITQFFTSTVGFAFVACVVLCVVVICLRRLMNIK